VTEEETVPEFVHEWVEDGKTVTFSWLGDVDVAPDRVYALAFTPEGKMLMVTDARTDPGCWVPGGGVEAGETAEEALNRELIEEANARMVQCKRIGIQMAEDAEGRQKFHTFYWCRIVLEDGLWPEHDITFRRLVRPDEYLDRLVWGHTDPKAPMLLAKALEIPIIGESNSELTATGMQSSVRLLNNREYWREK
jgi:ADP-ribose pyrophosphatase YjhB (NUDIX family)